jgi:hypothetical protein
MAGRLFIARAKTKGVRKPVCTNMADWTGGGAQPFDERISPPYLPTEATLEIACHRVSNRPEHCPCVS